MEKRHDALDAYRKSLIDAKMASAKPTDTTTPSKIQRPHIADPEAHAVRNYEKWMAAGNVDQLVEYYGFLLNPLLRRKILTWAVDRAREGNLQPLLRIGIEDAEPVVQKHLNNLLPTLPSKVLLGKVADGKFTIRERRTLAGLLGRSKDPEAGKILASMADHPDARVRESALSALAHFPVTRDLQFPIFRKRLTEDSNPDVRLRAVEGLAKLGSPAALNVLETVPNMDTATPEMSGAASACLARMRPRGSADDEYSPDGKSKLGNGAPFSKDLVVKILIVALMLSIAGYRLSGPIKRWYNKRFPPAVVQPPPAQ